MWRLNGGRAAPRRARIRCGHFTVQRVQVHGSWLFGHQMAADSGLKARPHKAQGFSPVYRQGTGCGLKGREPFSWWGMLSTKQDAGKDIRNQRDEKGLDGLARAIASSWTTDLEARG